MMKIYTGQTGNPKNIEEIRKRGMGIMISSCHSDPPRKHSAEFPCALDNGAFSNYAKKEPFDEYLFTKTLSTCLKHKIYLDFIVCPDIVAGGLRSLNFSCTWRDRLIFPRLALAVQDGMEPEHIWPISGFSHIFVGGTIEWKMDTLEQWVDLARKMGRKIHVGQIGKLPYLNRCKELGVDSCDSTSYVRNQSWEILDEFTNKTQGELCL